MDVFSTPRAKLDDVVANAIGVGHTEMDVESGSHVEPNHVVGAVESVLVTLAIDMLIERIATAFDDFLAFHQNFNSSENTLRIRVCNSVATRTRAV